MAKSTYQIRVPATPGATPSVFGPFPTLAAARQEAKRYDVRRDLTNQDLRIERRPGVALGSRDVPDGREAVFVEYAGPNR